MTKDEGLQILIDTIRDEKRHANYKRVCDLAELYYKYNTGDGLDTELKKIDTKQTELEFQQQVRLTCHITPVILASIKSPYRKVSRTHPLTDRITWNEKDDQQKQSEIRNILNKFNKDQSLDQYFEENLLNYNFNDPNAWLLLDFSEFDNKIEKAKPYPVEISAKEVIDFKYNSESLEYIITLIGNKHTIYLENDIIMATELKPFAEGTNEIGKEILYFDNQKNYYIDINKKTYLIEYFEPKGKRVQAVRFGFIQDQQTKGQTFVSIYDTQLPLLKKTIKVNSELDLSMTATAFPQRYMYISPCPVCGGKKMDMQGVTCDTCHGTGQVDTQNTVLDIMKIPLPQDKEDIIDLNKLFATNTPDIETLRFLNEFLDKKKIEIHNSHFNNELFTKQEVSTTATKELLDRDNIDDTLFPYAQKYSNLWIFVVEMIASFREIDKGINIEHQFPKHFKVQSLSDLMDELKKAHDSGASSSIIASIENDINDILYSDRPEELNKINIKTYFNPFFGMSQENIRLTISSGKTTQCNAILYDNYEGIWNELEMENEELYQMTKPKIKGLLDKKIEKLILEINKETQTTLPEFQQNGIDNLPSGIDEKQLESQAKK